MGKGRDKRRREVKELNELTRDVVARAYAEASATLSGSYPPALGEPDIPVRAPLKPKPHIGSGAIAVPEPEPEGAFLTAKPKLISK